MFSPALVISAICLYVALLFVIALWVERSPSLGKKLSNSPLVYSLCLGVYCTAWTYYGSVGKAASSGLLFLTIYLGPTMAIVFWWSILRRLIRIKNTYRITSIADFISARYNKSQGLAAIATFVAFVGSLPYIALQLKAVISTFELITSSGGTQPSSLSVLMARLIVLAIMMIFTILMGVRRLDPTERHPGMMVALAVECLVKLTAFIAAGIFVTYIMYGGFGNIFTRVSQQRIALFPSAGGTEAVSYISWVSYLLLAMASIMFLPRQFHVAVVENSNEKHVRTAMWLFPLYIFLLNIFVYPIAMGGLLAGHSVQEADTFVLLLPLKHGNPWLVLSVFIGGFSAAIGMIMINTMTVATMVTNHLLLPLTQWFKNLGFLARHALKCRWLVVIGYLLLGYWFELKIGASYMLVNIGMISFAAAFQFAPPILGGLFWRRGNRTGAILGLSGGFLVWFYTLLLPSFARSGWIPASLLERGPFGIGFLNPERLLGINVFDPLSHGVFWSLLVNISLYILGSLFVEQEDDERRIAEDFIDILKPSASPAPYGRTEAHIDISRKKPIIEDLLSRYFPREEAVSITEKCLSEIGVDRTNAKVSVIELSELNSRIEKFLTGSIGAATAHRALKQANIFTLAEAQELHDKYVRILADLKLTPMELKEKIDYYQEREKLIATHAQQLEEKIKELEDNILQRKRAEEALSKQTQELARSNTELERFAYIASHDLQEPLRTVISYVQLLKKRYSDKLGADADEFIAFTVDGVHWMQSLINALLTYSRIDRGPKETQTTDLNAVAARALMNLQEAIRENKAEISCDQLPTVKADSSQMEQLFQNLIGNAVKFHSSVPPRVHISVKSGKNEWILSVSDNGIGIAPQHMGRIFEIFQRLHSRKEYSGTGIGLAVCKKIVEYHGGRIWVESHLDKGSTFHFTIPE
jgi:Na+/proline symporter/signal transduction histidine kinase